MTALFTWVHLSDIHFGHGDAEHGWDQRLVLQALHEDLAEQSQQHQHQPDALLVTGDIAFSGKPEQYEQANNWLEGIGRAIGLGCQQIFTVPGNHDVDRAVDRNRDIARVVRTLRAREENLDAVLAHAPDREKLGTRLAAYSEFAARFAPHCMRATRQPPEERLFWLHREARGPLRLRIIGLNTALLSADDRDQGLLALGKEQLGRALVEPPKEPGELVIVLSHHPLHGGWLADEKEAVSWLHNHAHIHLFGHIHAAESEAARGGTGASFVRIAAGAVHEEKSVKGPMGHGYVIGSIIAEASGALQLRLWPRLWSPRHAGFVVDVHNVPRGREYIEHSLGVTLPAAGSHSHEHRGNLAPTILPISDEPRRTAPSSSPLLQMIDDAFERKRRLEAVGLPVHDILAEIRQLKREHRRGGQLRAGDVLGDRYLLVDQIGHGGFATVWKAYERTQNETVAIKVLHPNIAGDPERRRRFFRGARIMAELAHPAVVRIRERAAEDDGFFYFVMDFIPGGDLRSAVLEGRVTWNDGVPIILRVSDALAHAHRHGHLHRDVKPANILLTSEGSPLLTDFDLVAAADTTGGTRTGPLGTIVYAAPEMLDRPQEADARADVYGLGMTMLFIAYGRELPKSVLRDSRAIIEQLPCERGFKNLLHHAISWEADARHNDAAAFRSSLLSCHSVSSSNRSRQILISRKGAPGASEQQKDAMPTDTPFVRILQGSELGIAQSLQGAWRSPETGSTYFVKVMNDTLVIPYCYGSDDFLTGIYYDIRIRGSNIRGRFKWFSHVLSTENFAGYADLSIVSSTRLLGYWWMQDRVPNCRFPDEVPDPARGEAISWERIHRYETPEWAVAYFAGVEEMLHQVRSHGDA